MIASVESLPTVARSSPQSARDYRRVAEALRFIADHRREQPSLARVAEAVGLSEFHFQRLFVRWAGVTPKRFLQFLTKEHAKELLARGANVLEVARATGLSGGGRLHDLMIVTEGVSPGEVRAKYDGVVVTWGVHESPFGACTIATTPRGICAMSFDDEDAEATLRRDFPRATIVRAPERTRVLASQIFGTEHAAAPVRVVLHGTPFQLRVWQALLAVPEGSVCSYQALARAVGAPHAARAVGSAVASNRVALLIPCHRVIRAVGETGDYAWGAERKRAMLGREAARYGDAATSASLRMRK
jgi:AraC family transcriptional regulator of adaptative response/methylated-DNA-[protein]-cysteine methyltransferase